MHYNIVHLEGLRTQDKTSRNVSTSVNGRDVPYPKAKPRIIRVGSVCSEEEIMISSNCLLVFLVIISFLSLNLKVQGIHLNWL